MIGPTRTHYGASFGMAGNIKPQAAKVHFGTAVLDTPVDTLQKSFAKDVKELIAEFDLYGLKIPLRDPETQKIVINTYGKIEPGSFYNELSKEVIVNLPNANELVQQKLEKFLNQLIKLDILVESKDKDNPHKKIYDITKRGQEALR